MVTGVPGAMESMAVLVMRGSLLRLTFFPLLLQIVRNDSGEVVVLVLLALPVRDIGFRTEQPVFNFLHGFVRRNGDNINRKHQISVDITELVSFIYEGYSLKYSTLAYFFPILM